MAYLLKIDKYEGQVLEGAEGLTESWGYEAFKVDATLEKMKLGWFAALNAAGDMVYADATLGLKAVTAIYTASGADPFGAYVTNPNTAQAYFYTTGAREYRKLAEQTKMSVVINDSTGAILREYFRIKNATLTGTVTQAIGSADIVGVGTLFTTELKVGEKILVGAVAHVVATITDNTHFSTTVVAAGNQAGVALYGVGMYGEPLWLSGTGATMPFTMLKPASNAQRVGKIVGKTVALYDIDPIMA